MLAGLRAARFRVGGEELAVLSYEVGAPLLPESLTAAEREIALAIIDGMSNAEIAAARRTSVRTVANQVASVLRKTGAGSRAAFVATAARPSRT